MRRALSDWPIELADRPREATERPEVSFIIGHRGSSRLPHLQLTLRSIAAQRDVPFECVVVEQDESPRIQEGLPSWVRYVHAPSPGSGPLYNRSATFNAGVAAARGNLFILHDNDMLIPAAYAREAHRLAQLGWRFMELKRFIFYLSDLDTASAFAAGQIPDAAPAEVVQNLLGGSVVTTRDAYLDVGGFDESFVGWGGEDNEFWERAEAIGGVYRYGFLPIVHLWHAPQPGKVTRDALALRRYHDESRRILPEERIRRLRNAERLNSR